MRPIDTAAGTPRRPGQRRKYRVHGLCHHAKESLILIVGSAAGILLASLQWGMVRAVDATEHYGLVLVTSEELNATMNAWRTAFKGSTGDC